MTGARKALTRSREHLSQAFELMDEAVSGLPELEAGAVVLLRTETAAMMERLASIILFVRDDT